MNNRLLVAAIANHSTTTGLLPKIFSKWTWICGLSLCDYSDFGHINLFLVRLNSVALSSAWNSALNIFLGWLIFFSIVCSNFQFAPFFLAGKQLVFQFLGHCRFHRRVEGEVASWQRLPSWQARPPSQLYTLVFWGCGYFFVCHTLESAWLILNFALFIFYT